MTGRLLVRSIAALGLAGLIAGVPVMLATLVGWPLPASLPGWDELTVVLTSPPTERLVLHSLAVAAWALWTGFVVSLFGEVMAIARHGLADRRARPAGRNPAGMLAVVLLTAMVTGSFASTGSAAATATGPAPQITTTATMDGVATVRTLDAPAAGAAPSGPAPSASPAAGTDGRPGHRVALWEDPPPLPTSGGMVLVEVAGQRLPHHAGVDATLWDLAEQVLGDPRRWPEITDANPHLHQPANGQTPPVVLPDDATIPTDHTTVPAATTDDEDQAGQDGDGDGDGVADGQVVYEVRRGDWMWHIAGRYLGDELRYTEIADLNPQYAQRYPDYPDHIRAGDQLVLPSDAYDHGQRSHATGTLLAPPDTSPPEPDEPVEPAEPTEPDEPNEPAEPPATGPPPTPDPAPPRPPLEPSSPAPSPPASVAPEPSPPPVTPEATPTPPAQQGTPGPGAGDAPDDEDSGGQQPTAPPGAGVELPSGAWISIGLAALLAAVATVLRLSRRRRTRLAYPIEITTEPEPSPVPDSLRPADAAGLRALETTDDNDEQDDGPLAGVMPAPPATPAAVAVDEHGEQVSLFDLPGDGLCLLGQGALPAGRAILAAACATGVSQFPGARPMVLTSVDTLAVLLPNEVAPEGLDPHGKTFDGERLTVASDVGQAVTRAEEEMIARRRLLDELDMDTMDALNARDDHAEHQPRFLLLLRGPGRYAARLRVLAACRQVLHMHVVILDQQLDDLPAVDVAADGTYTTPTGSGRLSTLAAGELAEVLDLVRQALPRPEPEPHLGPVPPSSAAESAIVAEAATVDGPAIPTAPAAGFEVPLATGDQPPPVRLCVLGPVRLETDAGPVTSGLRGRAHGVLALLAAYPKGRTLEEIIDDLQPEDGLKDVRAAVRATINSVRATLRKTTGTPGKYLPYDNSTGRYTIDPNLISVDLWRMLAAIDHANALVDDDTACLAALRQAADCYGGDFAEGQDRSWVIDYATTYRNHILSVYGRIAEILELDAPDQAIAALERAAELDPVNEEVTQRIMRIHGRQNRPDAVRRTLRQLESRIAQIGHAEVSEATRRVAARQLASPAAARDAA